MHSILGLFEETKKDKKRFSKNKFIKDISDFPDLRCPRVGSKKHNKDMEVVKHYHDNKKLNKDFLEASHDSMNKLYKNFCKKNKLKVDWDFVKLIKKEVDEIIGHLKNKFERPRPKEILKHEDKDHYSDIPDMKSFSFPSGHTAAAYFLSDLLSHFFPKHKKDFRNLAALIGQSRIENGVHYPSDVLSGRLIGEICANKVINNPKVSAGINETSIRKKDLKKLSQVLREKALERYPEFSKKEAVKNFAYDFAHFIKNSCSIEGISQDEEEAYESVLSFLRGYPVEYCTSNPHIASHLNMMTLAEKIKPLDTPFKIINMHKQIDPDVLDRGSPGTIRDFKGYAKLGNSYAKPEDIFGYMSQLNDAKNPWVKHILYEWIHPFCDGNGRSGRVMLLVDCDYDFDNVNLFCDKSYLNYFKDFVEKYESIDHIFA